MDIYIKSQKYKIIKLIGEGAFGKVYKIKDEKENKFYALKKISILGKREEEINKIQNESKILSNINHENIVKFFNFNKDLENFNILMEYCEGPNLGGFIDDYKKKIKILKNIYYIKLFLIFAQA